MGFSLRESDDIRTIRSLDGKTYRLQKSPFGFGEEYIFYDPEGNEIECFSPRMDNYEEVEGFYIFEKEEKVLFEGRTIVAEFSFSEFFQ